MSLKSQLERTRWPRKKKTDFDVESILQDFAALPDTRSHINQRHLLRDVIIISIIAVIAGAEGPKAIGVWTKSDEDWLTDRHQLPNGIPSHDTIGRVLMTIKPSAFQVCFERWSKRLLARIIHQELVE
ncbi:transposase family protein [Rhodopirellula europaea]|uniref:transposase family protein n=1 Tax=Rhodopirellula europaea TaxID=1263866 RepID=UPI003D2978B7